MNEYHSDSFGGFFRRDTIVTRGDAQAKMNKKILTKGTFQRQMAEMKKKIKSTIQEGNQCDGSIHEMRLHQQELSGQLEEHQLNVQQLQGSADTLDGDIDRFMENKQKVSLHNNVKRNRIFLICLNMHAHIAVFML